MSENIVIIDNGGGSVKLGFGNDDIPILNFPNVTAKIGKSVSMHPSLIADQVIGNANGSNLVLTRPCDRGYINNWQCQIDIWNYLFNSTPVNNYMKKKGHSKMSISPEESSLILTEPPLNLESVQNETNEVVFEYFQFKEYIRKPSAWFSAYHFNKEREEQCLLSGEANLNSFTIVDSGFSFTHSIPFVNFNYQKQAIRRVNIGGKLLTNYLKEIVKEDLCYVSSNYLSELKNAKLLSSIDKNNSLRDPFNGRLKKQFVLPDYHKILKGYVKEDDEILTNDEQVLLMEIERFCVPELLFYPSDIGVTQAGVVEATWQSLQCLPMIEIGLASSNIILTGGNVNLFGFKEKFEKEIRTFIPDLYPVNVYSPPNPETYAWRGASRYVKDSGDRLSLDLVTREEYLEYGHYYCNNKMSSSY